MIEAPVLTAAEREARAAVCQELSQQLDNAAELLDGVDLVGWARHLRHDAELLAIRATHELEE